MYNGLIQHSGVLTHYRITTKQKQKQASSRHDNRT